MKTRKVNKQGISLIVLVITIIVMIILAAAIILSLDNAGIINKANKAVEDTDLAQAKHLAALKWADAYLDDSITDKQGYVISELAKQGITEDDYKITFTENGVDVELKDGNIQADVETPVPEEWSENVVKVINGVPIPKGFVASPYQGEKTKDGGLVIYELKNNETAIPGTETHQTSLTTRNQYVWVPVDNFSEFVRGSYDNTTYSNVLGSEDYWEVVINTITNMPEPSQSANYVTNTTPEGGITNTLAEVQAMYESVKEYKGFYIARYEAGIDEQRTERGTAANLPRGTSVYSRMNKIPYTYIPWTWNNAMNEDTNGAVEVARSMYPVTNTNYGVVSTLTYGVQWDTTLKWWLDVDAKDINGNEIDVQDSTDYGNHYNHIIMSKDDLNDGALVWNYAASSSGTYVAKDSKKLTYPKSSGTNWGLSTGALKAAKVNNIYDMAGNMYEWTMEGYSTSQRVLRGGYFGVSEATLADGPVAYRSIENPIDTTCGYGMGFRPALYIKK